MKLNSLSSYMYFACKALRLQKSDDARFTRKSGNLFVSKAGTIYLVFLSFLVCLLSTFLSTLLSPLKLFLRQFWRFVP
jgi:hypothetical protein